MTKKTVKAPLSYDPGKGRPKEHLAYLNWQEMQELQRINGGNMERGPRGLPSFPPADARGSSSKASSSSKSSSSKSYGGGARDSGQAASKSTSRSTSGGGGGARDSGQAAARSAAGKSSGSSYGGGGRDSGRAASKATSAPTRSVGAGGIRALSSGPSVRGPVSRIPASRSVSISPVPSRTSVYSGMNLRGPLGPDGSPIPQPTTFGTNFQTAQILRATYPDVAKKYTQDQIVGALDRISSALPGEADVRRYGPGTMTDLGRVSLNQIIGGFSPDKAVAALDTTGVRKGTEKFAKPSSYSLGMTENWADKQEGAAYKNMAARSIQDALLQRNVSPEAMNASNFVAAGSKPVRGTQKIGSPVNGTQFLSDPTWGDRIEKRNADASNILKGDYKVVATAAPGVPVPKLKPINDTEKFRLKDPNVLDNVDPVAMSKLIRLQEEYGKPLTITSGYRDSETNEKAGGVKKSQHMHGNAVDIAVPGASAEETARLIRTASGVGFTGIGGYRPGKIHVDIGSQRVWGPDTTSQSVAKLPSSMQQALKSHAGGATPKIGIDYASMESGSGSVVMPTSKESQVAGLSQPAYQPYGMTVEQKKAYDETVGRKNKVVKGAQVVSGIASPVPLVGTGIALANKAIDKAAEAKINKYVAADEAERAEMERKDPSLIGWANVIGVQPQNDYSVYDRWAEERGLRGPGESRGQQQGAQYAGGIGALPSGTPAMSGTPATPSTPSTPKPSGVRPYEHYQWDVGVNIPSPADPNYTNYQEYLRRRAAAYTV